MTWEQQIMACQAIGDFSLRMRHPGDWYVDHRGIEKKNGPILCGGCVTQAANPEVAVEKHWRWLTSDEDGDRVVINAYGENRREVRWNGFMWHDVPTEKAA